MAQLPTASDYGPRASTRSDRYDKPSTDGVDMAETLVQATNVFHQTMEQAEGKQHALNYNLARNNLLLADMETREKYEQDTDWQTLDKRYSESYKSRSESIISSSNLSPYDRSLIESESAMIAAKGRIDMAARARAIEIDEGFTGMMRSVENLSQVAANESPGNRVRAVNSVLETIDSALEMGYFGLDSPETKAEELRDKTTKDIARMSIGGMTNDEKLRHIGAVLGYRRGYGVDAEYAPLFMTAAQKYDLPADLLVAVGMQESSMNPNAVSPKGAVGVMQLMPATAKNLGVTDRNDPAQSIDAGAGLLRFELDRYDGDKAKALAAYNAGGKKLNEWIAKHGENWLEELPADHETKKYVNKLLPVWEGTAPPQEYLTATNTGQGPLTREEVLGGKGTGLVGDFLHTDELAKIYDEAYKENKAERERTQAQSAIGEAYRVFPGDHEKRRGFIKENYSGAVEKMALTDLEIEENARATAERREGEDLHHDYFGQIRARAGGAEPFSMDEIPPQHLGKMTAAQIRDLEAHIKKVAKDEQFAPVTRYFSDDPDEKSLEYWDNLPDFGENSKITQDLEEWTTVLDESDWMAARGLQNDLRAMQNEAIAIPNVKPIVQLTLESIGYGSDRKLSADDKNTLEARVTRMLRTKVAAYQADKKVAATEKQIDGWLSEIMLETAYYSKPMLGGLFEKRQRGDRWGSREPTINIATATADELENGYIPIDRIQAEMYAGPDEAKQGLSMYEILRKDSRTLAPAMNDEDRDRAIERAYFAMKAGMGDAAVNMRLSGK